MEVRHRFILLAGLLMGLLVVASLGVMAPSIAHAAGTGHPAKKGDVQILPHPLAHSNISPRVSAPANTTSYYESTTAYGTLQSQGCSAARGPAGIVVLDFGEPVDSSGTYGTNDFGGHFDSFNAIFHAAANFIVGAWNCRTSSTNIALALGTSNYGGAMGGYSASTWYVAGQSFGGAVNSAQSFSVSNGYSNQIGVFGADDVEVEWANFTLTSNFVNGYNNASSRLFFDYGDDSGGANPAPWTAYDVWYVAWGASDSYPLPEIYYNADATADWEQLNLWACSHEGGPMYIKGTMAEYPSGANTPAQAFDDMYNAEAAYSCSSPTLSTLIFSTNI